MALEEYKRKRDFARTPEPGAKVGKRNQTRRFVVQKHHASHLHFDFRLEMEGVLKSWAVPKGPSLDPTDKRLAMMVEDHPVSYFDFEGIIPPDNYGAGTVMVWDMGTWEPMAADSKEKPDPAAMLKKGDLKFRLRGKKLNGDFVLAHMRSRRPGSKGNEWLMIKKHDEFEKAGFDANDKKLDRSVITGRSLKQIAGDAGSAEWESSRPAAKKAAKNKEWLKESLARVAKKKSAVTESKAVGRRTSDGLKKTPAKASVAPAARGSRKGQKSASDTRPAKDKPAPASTGAAETNRVAVSQGERLKSLRGASKEPMPTSITPMLATLVEEPFDSPDWLFEVKFDGYRALAFVENGRGGGRTRLVSRNQNDLTAEFPEFASLPDHIHAQSAILDGEICALDEEGRPSFSLIQQRTGVELGKNTRRPRNRNIKLVFYIFDLLYLDGYSLLRLDLEKRKELLKNVLKPDARFRYSDHFFERGIPLYRVAKEKGLEGIVAKLRRGCYLQKRSREWLKIKITQRQECVIGGYTEPRGSREHFGSLVLGLYDDRGRLIPVGQAGSGFTHKTHEEMWKRLEKLKSGERPFSGKVESLRAVHFVKPELVAEIKFTEWTHEGQKSGLKMRAPVFQGLRFDKKPTECRFEGKRPTAVEARKAERESAA